MPIAIDGIEVAYYLAHSMAGGEAGFAERDRQAARAFASAAAGTGVRGSSTSAAWATTGQPVPPSRQPARRGRRARRHGVAVTEFRAAIVIGSGSASFEILRHLTERLPVMITPRWVSTRCQPIGIADVLAYLVGALDHPEVTGVVEIGGPDILSYGQMMLRYAHLRGLRRLMIPVPVLTPRLSSYWVNLISPVPASIARPLIEGLRNEVVVRHPGPAEPSGSPPRATTRRSEPAMDRNRTRHELESTWFDALRAPERSSARVTAITRGDGRRPPDGARRRRAPDRSSPTSNGSAAHGAGRTPTSSGASAASSIASSAASGCAWAPRSRPPARRRRAGLLARRGDPPAGPAPTRAEMKVPGRAWLQYEVEPDRAPAAGSCQTAFFEPKGLPGLAYWYSLYPVHAVIFRGNAPRPREAGRPPGRGRAADDLTAGQAHL